MTCITNYDHNFILHKGDVSIPCLFCTYHIDNTLSTQCTICRQIACTPCLKERHITVFDPTQTETEKQLSLKKQIEILKLQVQKLEERILLLENFDKTDSSGNESSENESEENESTNPTDYNTDHTSLPVIG